MLTSKRVMNLIKSWFAYRRECINRCNKKRLTNFTPTLICSNCTGGMIYHWLGLQFRSPFINLWMTNEDFLLALESFDDFINTPLLCDKKYSEQYNYPVGIGFGGVRVFFMHYKSWEDAIAKWNQRVKRIDRDNMAVMLTNFNGFTCGGGMSIIKRFEALPFKHKVIFVDRPIPDVGCAVHLKRWKPESRHVFNTQHIDGRLYLDQFDYVEFINNLKSVQ